MMVPVPPSQWRYLLVTTYKSGIRSWGEVFCELYNGGWRSSMDRDGFPTRREAE